MSILTKYYRETSNRELRFLTGEIEDFIEDKHKELEEALSQTRKDFAESSLLSLDNNLLLAKSGEMGSVQNNLITFMDALNSTHPLKPYYGYELGKGNILRSVPLSPQSAKLHPPRFDISATKMRLGNTPISKIDRDIFKKAYNHQIPIHFDIVEAKKFLGTIEDPVQEEANEMIGAHAIVKSPEFPPAFPCNVTIGKDVIVDYLLLRTKEILDDGTYIITNDEQKNFNFYVKMFLNPISKKLTFNVTPHNPTNRQYLKYKQLMQRANSGEQVILKILSLNQPLVLGTVDHREINQLDAEIEFLKKIITIEDYFNTTIIIPKEITVDDHIVINHLVDLIEGSYKGSWNEFEFKFNLTEETIKRIEESSEQAYVVFYTGEGIFDIFGKKLKLPLVRRISNAKIFNLEKTKKKAAILDIGDELKVLYVPEGEKGEYLEQIYSEEIKQSFLIYDSQSEEDA